MSIEDRIPQYFSGYMKNYREWVILGLLTLLALATRGYGIWEWSLVGDEYFTVAYAQERVTRLLNPAYYALVLGSTKLFGLAEWSARLPSVILGTLSVPFYYVLCRGMLDRQTAVVGALLIIFSEWHLYYSQLSRFYSGVFLFGVVSYFIYFKSLQNDSYWLLGGALLSNVVGVLFHVTSILVPVSCAGYSLVLLLWSSTSSSYSKRIARMHLSIVSIAALITFPFLFSVAHSWNIVGRSTDIIWVLLDLMENVGIVLAIAAIFGLFLLWRIDPSRGIFFAVGIGVPVGMLVVGSIVLPHIRAKYIFYVLPLIITLAGFLCAQVASLFSQYRVAKFAVAGILIVSLLPGFASHYTGHRSLDVRDATRVIRQAYLPGDKIVVFDHAIAFYLRDSKLEKSTRVLGGKAIWKQALLPLEGEGNRVWVIVDTYRNGRMRSDLESWLMEHASLVWRGYERRFDYSMMGYEIWLVGK